MGNLCCEVGMNENRGGLESQETQGLGTLLTAFASHFSCPAVLLLDRPCVFIAIPVATFSYALSAPDAKSSAFTRPR